MTAAAGRRDFTAKLLLAALMTGAHDAHLHGLLAAALGALRLHGRARRVVRAQQRVRARHRAQVRQHLLRQVPRLNRRRTLPFNASSTHAQRFTLFAPPPDARWNSGRHIAISCC